MLEFFSSFALVLFPFQLSFKCSGSSQPPPSTMESHVDPHNGVHLVEVTATISRDLVDEYFGKTPFRCDCHAWSSRGGAKSQGAVVEVACKYFLQVRCKLSLSGVPNNISFLCCLRVLRFTTFPEWKSTIPQSL